jgi:hypothetical protein
MKRETIVGLIIVLAISSLSFAKQPEYKPGSVLVRFTDANASTTVKNNIINTALNRTGNPVKREYSVVKGMALVQLPADINVESAVASLKQSSSVLYAEPDYIYHVSVIPNDTSFSQLWGMTKISAPAAWDISTGSSSIIVAVTDTGVDYTHPDLAANMWSDANGAHGYDFVNNDSDPMDDEGHGTHVSGTIGAVGNNNLGVAGVNWHTRIMALKFLDATGSGSTSNVVAAIQYAIANGAKVINASWRGYGFSQPLYDSIAAARDAGIIFVAGAGNENVDNDSTPAYPASFDLANIISVMATTNTDASASYSNYGLMTVDLGAPGDNILSTKPGGIYEPNSGTSMSSPHVAGACALLLSIDPTLTYSQVKQILINTVDKTLPGLCVSGGRLNLAAAAQEAAVDTTPPTPNPPQWAAGAAPKATGRHTAIMQAGAVTDRSGVEYYFECVSDVNKNSGWTANTLYSFTTLAPATTYGFHFKARDKSSNHNQTGWSTTGFVTTSLTNDNLGPFPDPPQWATPPKANPQMHQIRMAAGIGHDESTPVQYQFSYQYGTNPEVILPWQSSNLYYFTPPSSDPYIVYNFRFHVRDANGNETAEWSMFASARMFTGSIVLSVPIPYPTIQIAIDHSVNGDIIEVSPGVYDENNISFRGLAITVKSLDPTNPAIVDCFNGNTIIVPGYDIPFLRRGFIFSQGEGADSILDDIAIRDGVVFGGFRPPATTRGGGGLDGLDAFGGGILCTNSSSPTIRNCIITYCQVIGGFGGDGGPGDTDAPPAVNGGSGGDSGLAHGGGIYVSPGSNPVIANCTISNCATVPGNGGNGGAGGDADAIQGTDGGAGGNISDYSGGGIYVEASGNASIIGGTVSDCITYLNDAAPGTGGPGGNGNPRGATGPDGSVNLGNGAGIFFNMSTSSSNINVSAVDLTSNNAWNNGGGAGFGPANGKTVTLSGCQFSGNSAGNGDEIISANENGGGLCFANTLGTATLVLSNCTFTNNIAERTGGGLKAGQLGVSLGSNLLQINGSSFTGNSAREGGGIYIDDANLSLTESTLTANEASEGGGINGFSCSVDIRDSNIIGNTAFSPGGIGGGVAFWNTTGDINNSVLKNNTANSFGGAAFMDGWTTSPLQFTNCLITDNNAFYEGGALSCNLSGWAKLLNCTLVGNSTTSGSYGTGGAISSAENFAWVQLENCILWNNSALNGPQIAVGTIFGSSPDGSGPFADVDVSYDDVEGGQDAVYIEDPAYTAVWWLAGNLTDDPMFVDIDVNAPSYYLSQVKAGQSTNSPCVDAGSFAASVLKSLIGEMLTTRTDLVEDANMVDIGYHYETGAGTVAGGARQYNLTIEVYKFDPNEGGNGRLKAQSQPGSDYPFDINDTNTIQVIPGTMANLIAAPDPCFKVQYWSGTDNDGSTALTNTVTMNTDKKVVVAFAPNGLYYLTVTVIGNGTVTPLGRTLHQPGEVVALTAIPANPSNKITWTGTNDDASQAQTNTVTMTTHKNVTVEFYTPRILYVGGNSKYPTIQAAIDDANERDIVMLMPSDQPYYTQQGYSIRKNITITSVDPYNPSVVASTVIQQQMSPGGDRNFGPAFDFEGVSPLARLMGITIRGFSAGGYHILVATPSTNGGFYDGEPGGFTPSYALYCLFASPTIVNCVIDDCHVFGDWGGDGAAGDATHPNGGNGGWAGGAYGGALYMEYYSNPTLIGCVFSNNTATGGNGGNGGAGAAPPTTGRGGRGGGWYYGYQIPSPWERPIPGPGDLPKDYSGLGGAVYVDTGCAPIFENCSFVNNFSTGGLNGICGQNGWIPNPVEEPTIRYKIANLGGAVYLNAGASAIFNGCEFTDNIADTNRNPNSFSGFLGYGGAVAAEDGATPTFIGCNINNNLSDIGGGIYSSWAYPVIEGGIFSENTATHGGGVLIANGLAVISGSRFISNSANISGSEGGAIAALGANAEINDCNIFSNRSSGNGGGIYVSSRNIDGNEVSGGNSVLIKNCLITNNVADLDGGGIAAAWLSDPNIVNCTIVNNTAGGMGAGLSTSYGSFANVINSIIWGNFATKGSQIAVGTKDTNSPVSYPSTVKVRFSDVNSVKLAQSGGIDANAVPVIRAGFVTDTLAANDDESTGLVDIGFTINFFGRQYSQLYVNNNGNVTFDANMRTFTPFGLTGNIGTSIIAPFFADVDTRVGNITVFGPNNVGDHNAFGVTWTNVGYFSQHTDKTNTFQMLLIDRSDRAAGDFDIEFNYERIQWETGDVSGGANGFGGQSAHTGFSNGSGNEGTFYEFPGSGVPGSFLDSGPAATRLINNSRSSAVAGRYIFTVRGGLPALLTAEPFYVNPDSNLDGFRFDTASNDWLPAADSNNIGADPCFVRGVGYFLSQIAAGQLFTSPCVDAGSADANSPGIDLANYTTRTDSVNDVNIVDMGYHYTVTTATAHQYSLTIEVVNDTGGTLTAQGGGDSAFTITAPVTVTRMVNAGTEVSLHAAVQAGFALLGWTGTNDDTSTSTNNTVTMNSNKVVKVTFHQYQLTIQVLKPGGFDPNGYLTATGYGIDPFAITSRNEPNSRSVAPGTIVQLKAFPDVNYSVLSWSGTDNDGSTALTNAVTMNSDVNVIVAFQPDGLYYLTVTVIGNGTVTPLGTTLRTPGEAVALTAIPTNPSDKISWTGTDDDASQAQTNTVTMTTHKNVTVEFYSPRILYVGGDSNYPTIQMAIDDANDRDIVMITPGFYNIVESSQDHSYLLINGKDITLTSTSPENPEATVITGKFMIYNVSRKCVIQGLTISDNVYWDNNIFDPTGQWFVGTPTGEGEDAPPAFPTPGAGMTLNGSASPTVRNVRFVNCWARGIHGGNGAASVAGNPGNGGPGGRAMGGGAYCGPDGSPLFENCFFTGCLARGGDGGNGGDGSATIMPGHGGAWGDKNWPLWEYGPLMDYWWYTGCGGAIYCDEGSTAEFVNCNFIDNNTIGGSCGITGAGMIMFGWPYSHYKIQSFGGAVYAATGSAPTFTDCNFTDNMADPNGALIHRQGGATVAAYPTTSYGGAIAFENGASPLFTKCTFTGNLAAVGGAVYCDEAYPEFDASAFIGNSALHGGGVMFSQGFSIVNQCYFTGNEGTYPAAQGGAIAALGANAEITDCNILRNRSAGDGGGIYVSSRNIDGNEAPGGNSVLIKNCLIASNVANLEGGGIAAVWFSDPNIVNCTIVNNTAGGRGAGVSSSYGSFVNIVNNIIWDNVTGIGANGSQLAVSVAPSAMLVHNSDIQGATDPNQFGRQIQSLDLVFCIDTTGSMVDDIDAVKAAARQITNAIGSQFPDYRIALADYRDFYDDQNTAAPYGSPGDRPYRDDVNFTTNANRIIAGLQPLVAAGGGDGPESVYAALMHCIDANALEARLNANGNERFIDANSPGPGSWRTGRDVLRVVMLMGDAPPHDPEPYTDYTLNDIATAAMGRNPVHVMPILIGNAADATTAFTSIATVTGGTVVQAADANAVVGAVLQAVSLMKVIPAPIFVDVNCVTNWDPCTMQWEPGSGNINADPCFVAGYFLSQIPAGQPVTSPCVDAGSADANSPGIDLANYTTRTDYVGDQGVVDMGYHYPYHYPLFAPLQYRLDFNAVVGNGLLAGDIEPNSGLFNWFTTVPLRVNRDPGGYQVLWTGTDNDDANGTTNTVLMDRPRAVTVAFVSNTCTLTAEVIGGHGTITPADGTYPRNTVVALTAVPDAGYRVNSWSGTDNDNLFTQTNTVKMAGDKHVTVEFQVPQIKTVPGDFTTIQSAVEAARPGDIVSVASGLYHGSAIVINKDITLTSTNPDDPCVVASTIIDSSGFASQAIVFSGGATSNTVLDGFTITGGTWFRVDATGNVAAGQNGIDGGPAAGGAVYIDTGASPTIKNCVIRDTTITGASATAGGNADATVAAGRGGWPGGAYGGGVYVREYASPTFINCTIRDCNVLGGNAGNGGNSSGSDFGAADYRDANYGGSYSNSFQGVGNNYLIPPQPWQSMRNSSGQPYRGDYGFYSGLGGGVFCDINSAATFISCNIVNNAARGGMSGVGGTRPQGIVNADPVTAYRIPSYGGGVYCGLNSNVEFIDCNIKNNLTPKPDTTYHTDPYLGHGGGIAFENTASVILTGCNISDNISAVGGGMFWSGSAPVLRDCNISANTAYVGGGAYGKGGASLIEDCNILRNFAGISPNDVDVIVGQGGGIFSESMDANIIDSRFVDNTVGASGAAIYFHGPVDGGDNTANITNCLMIGNTAGRDGGGISANWNVSVKVANCTLHSNNATGSFGDPNGHTGLGGGLYCGYGASTSVIDSILWRNDANFGPEIAVDTGFELDQHCGSVNVSYSDVRGSSAGTYVGESGNCSANLTWAGGNIGVDPKFVSEIISDYRLQQVTAGQTVTSPCVNAGSSSAINAGLGLYTTRTDEVPDRGKVDMGYHYAVEQPCRFVDIGNKILTGGRTKWMKDGVIDWTDFAVLADSWLSGSCSPANTWCEGADLTFDSTVNWEDLALISQCWLAADTTPPSPNPSQWRIIPTGVWPNKVKMAAVDSIDNLWGLRFDTTHPVQYQFQCTSGNGHDRDWQYDANYTDTGLQSYTEYAYRVRARDLVGNTTNWSSVQWTVISPDSIPPTPNPMTWNVEPYAASGTSISMTATTASDDSGGIQYEFEINEPSTPIFTSGWRDDPNYTITGLDPVGPYCFRVKARDVFDNETGWSEQICVSNLGDVTPPSPAPNILWLTTNWNVYPEIYDWSGAFTTTTGTVKWWHRVAADVTGITDDSGGPLEVRFICDGNPNNALSSASKVGQPIIIGAGGILGGHSATDTYQVYWNGNTIFYDVYVNSSTGHDVDHVWRVCVYDPTLNSACSNQVEMKFGYIGPP